MSVLNSRAFLRFSLCFPLRAKYLHQKKKKKNQPTCSGSGYSPRERERERETFIGNDM